MTDFAMISDDGAVRLERAFPVSVDQLWAYLTTPDGLRRWIADGQIGPDRARLRFADNGSVIDGAVTAWEPPSLAKFEWDGGHTQPHGSRVRFELSPDGAGSRLVLTHSRTAGPAAPDFAAGWHRHLDTLGYLTRGTEPPAGRQAWHDLHQHYLALAGVGGRVAAPAADALAACVVAVTAFGPLSMDMYLPACPHLSAVFHATPSGVQHSLGGLFHEGTVFPAVWLVGSAAGNQSPKATANVFSAWIRVGRPLRAATQHWTANTRAEDGQ